MIPAWLWNCPKKGAAGSCLALAGAGSGNRCWEGERNSLPGISSPPGLARGSGGDARRGEGGGCHEEAAEDAGCGETGAAPAFPKLGLLAGPAERASGRNRVGRKRPRRKSTGMRGWNKAGSEHVPEAQTQGVPGSPASRTNHGSSREATAGNWLGELATAAALPGSLSCRLIWAQLSLLSPATTSREFFFFFFQLGPSFKLRGAFLGRAAPFPRAAVGWLCAERAMPGTDPARIQLECCSQSCLEALTE